MEFPKTFIYPGHSLHIEGDLKRMLLNPIPTEGGHLALVFEEVQQINNLYIYSQVQTKQNNNKNICIFICTFIY